MKKSEIYRKAQLEVLSSTALTENEKLEILRELMDRESTAIYTEKRAESEGADNE